MNKRDLVLSLIEPGSSLEYIPAAFFLHFDPAFHRGEAAVLKHLEFFRRTDMDFVKIRYEHAFPRIPPSRAPKIGRASPSTGRISSKTAQGGGRAHESHRKRRAGGDDIYSPSCAPGKPSATSPSTTISRRTRRRSSAGWKRITASLMGFINQVHPAWPGWFLYLHPGR